MPSHSVPGHPEIERIVAPNPGPMTLEGTNTYVVARDPAYVIDPGPDQPGHLVEVRAVAESRGGIAGVLLTHGHADHSAGVAALGAPLLWGSVRAEEEMSAPAGRPLLAGRPPSPRPPSPRRRPRSGPSRSFRRRATPPTTSPSSPTGPASAAT